jgi:hypothetical protein
MLAVAPTTTWVDDHGAKKSKKALRASRMRACVPALRRQDRVPGTHRKVSINVIKVGHLCRACLVFSQQYIYVHPVPPAVTEIVCEK